VSDNNDQNGKLNHADVQGNILRGYRKQRVRYLMLKVTDATAARRWLTNSLTGSDGVPQITSESSERWEKEKKPGTCFNIGLTYEGLRTLGTPAASLADFPTEFKEGMTKRAVKLADVGPSAPENWEKPFDQPAQIHIIASIYVGNASKPDAAVEVAQLDAAQRAAVADKWGLSLLGTRDGWCFNGDYVHFNYTDNISQPKFAEIHNTDDYGEYPDWDSQPMAPLGTVLLGYETNFEGLKWRVPRPPALGFNGSFNAFRVLEQDVVGFEEYLTTAANYLLAHPKVDQLLPPGAEVKIGAGLSRRDALREVVAANMCGRWRNGVPLALSPDTPNPSTPVSKTNFDYDSGSRCPYGAHIRRCNPRGAQIVQRVANHSRRLVRRGMPYGPAYVHDPAVHDPSKPRDPKEPKRGLLGNFIGANLGAQFEAMSCDWLNLGLQDPRVTGSNDPLLGANDPVTGWFDLPLPSGEPIRLRALPRFVTTRGGAYTFLPSLSAIGYLGSLSG
jgi:deferrochelatase/peroxidase EfeB